MQRYSEYWYIEEVSEYNADKICDITYYYSRLTSTYGKNLYRQVPKIQMRI